MRCEDKEFSQICSKLVGVPYSVLDCWGLAVEFYKQVFEIDLKRYYDEIPQDRDVTKNLIYTHRGEFEEVKDRKMGDLITIRLFGIESHIAIYLGNNKILHTSKHSGGIIENISKWEKLIVGFYRIKK